VFSKAPTVLTFVATLLTTLPVALAGPRYGANERTLGTGPAASQVREMDYVVVPPARRSDGRAAKVIFLNRCVGSCDINIGSNSAQSNSSTIPSAAGKLTAFKHGDASWAQVVSCVRELYRPYNVDITDVQPDDATAHVEVMVAGSPAELNLEANTLGIAPLTQDCSPQKNVLAFAFANAHDPNAMVDLCATAAHEAGHVFGLDHAFTCRDPMTYLTGCGQKFFLNLDLPCGEFAGTRPCRCGDSQNSHRRLTDVFDIGTLPGGPAVSFIVPAAGAQVQPNFGVAANVVDKRWLARVELWINGGFLGTVSPKASSAPVTFTPPRTLPDGVLNIEVRAYNDLGVRGTSAVQAMKGAPCTASSCLAGQSCTDGACLTPPAPGKLGDVCESSEQCAEHICSPVTESQSQCSSICVVGAPDQCGGDPQQFSCQTSASGFGLCIAAEATESAGCCQTGSATTNGVNAAMLSALVACLLARRRQRV
jgi:Metallo-peptidase family M12B Reprolysin-like/Bacterial Ig domain